MIREFIEKKFLSSLDNITIGSIEVITPGNVKHLFKGKDQGVDCNIHIKSYKFYFNILLALDTGFAKSYSADLCYTSDLTPLFLFIIQNIQSTQKLYKNHPIISTLLRIYYKLKQNTIRGSKKNILAHYDIGNEFYKEWLDSSLTYSSGIFNNKNESLQQAQKNKYSNITKLLGSPSNVLEIGCGWGGFIEHLIERENCKITGLTISEQQYAHIKDKFKDKSNINLLLQDYRLHTGKYDAIVSIEMIEAVGEKYWPIYFKKIKDCLTQPGVAVIQAILIDDKYFDEYKKGGDFIRSIIFPGGMLLSKNTIYHLAKEQQLKITHFDTFGDSYAITLQKWLINFDSKMNCLNYDNYFLKCGEFIFATVLPVSYLKE